MGPGPGLTCIEMDTAYVCSADTQHAHAHVHVHVRKKMTQDRSGCSVRPGLLTLAL